jgi:hypothetical protein
MVFSTQDCFIACTARRLFQGFTSAVQRCPVSSRTSSSSRTSLIVEPPITVSAHARADRATPAGRQQYGLHIGGTQPERSHHWRTCVLFSW